MDSETISAAAETLRRAAGPCSRVMLFGSRARGNAAADADLDFLVVEDQVEDRLSEMVRLRDALPPLGVPVDVVVVSESEFTQRSKVLGSLVNRASREGHVVAGG